MVNAKIFQLPEQQLVPQNNDDKIHQIKIAENQEMIDKIKNNILKTQEIKQIAKVVAIQQINKIELKPINQEEIKQKAKEQKSFDDFIERQNLLMEMDRQRPKKYMPAKQLTKEELNHPYMSKHLNGFFLINPEIRQEQPRSFTEVLADEIAAMQFKEKQKQREAQKNLTTIKIETEEDKKKQKEEDKFLKDFNDMLNNPGYESQQEQYHPTWYYGALNYNPAAGMSIKEKRQFYNDLSKQIEAKEQAKQPKKPAE